MLMARGPDLRTTNPGVNPRELDRNFHRLYRESGNMPLSFLRRFFPHRGLLPAAAPG